MEPPRHRAFFVIRRLAGDLDPEPENPGNPHKQRKKQRKQDSARGARGWARMDARLYWVCGESDCWKVIWDRCSGGVKTLKDFVIFGGFEVQRAWESS